MAMVVEIVLLVAVLLLLVGQLAGHRRSRADEYRDEYRRAQIERRLDLIMAHLGVTDPDRELPEVHAHLARGERIKAIGAYCRATGADLRTAQAAVDRLAGRR
jgi:hypothetical protein